MLASFAASKPRYLLLGSYEGKGNKMIETGDYFPYVSIQIQET